MAVLLCPDGTLKTLGHRTLVGRAAYCAVRLTDEKVSAEHASIYYDKGAWYLRDLASTNGTFIDGLRVELGRKNPLSRGTEIGFGVQSPAWVFKYDEPPRMRLRRVSDASTLEPLGGLLVLPTEDRPLLTLYQSQEAWIEEREGVTRALTDNSTLDCEDERYVVELPPVGGETAQTGLVRTNGWAAFDELTLGFEVSRDREAISLLVNYGEDCRVVSNRAYHEMLLILAEERLRSLEQGASEMEQGWIHNDELCRRVAGDMSKINVDVFRARQQLDQLGIIDAHRIVERRSSTRQLRFGTALVSIRYDVTAPTSVGDVPRSTPPQAT